MKDYIQIIKDRGVEIMNSLLNADNQGKGWVCPNCKNGSGKSGDGIRLDPHSFSPYFKCFACGEGGDALHWAQIVFGGDFNKALDVCKDILHLDNSGYKPSIAVLKKTNSQKFVKICQDRNLLTVDEAKKTNSQKFVKICQDRNLLTVDEAAKMLGISRNTLINWSNWKGFFEPVMRTHVKQLPLYSQEQIEQLLSTDFKSWSHVAFRYIFDKNGNNKLLTNTELPDFSPFLIGGDHLDDTNYFINRGLDIDICRKHHCIFVRNWRHPNVPEAVPTKPVLIIPNDSGGYLARDVRDKDTLSDKELQYIKQNVAPSGLFNSDALSNDVVIIVEGAIDAMSVEKVGYNAVALNSIGNKHFIIDKLKSADIKPKIALVCLDNETANSNAEKNVTQAINYLCDNLNKLGVFAVKADITADFHDANDALIASPTALKANIDAAINNAKSQLEKSNNVNSQSFGTQNHDKKSNISQTFTTQNHANLENAKTDDEPQLMQLYADDNYEEAVKLADTTVDTFLAADSVTSDDILQPDLLCAIGYYKHRQTDALKFQTKMAQIKEKCKGVISLIGDGGFKQMMSFYVDKFVAFDAAKHKRLADERRAQIAEHYAKQALKAEEKKFPLDYSKVVLPDDLHFDFDNQVTTRFNEQEMKQDNFFDSINVITKRFKNADTDDEKYEVYTLKANEEDWTHCIDEVAVFSDHRRIVALSSKGLDVDSVENPKKMVLFLKHFARDNTHIIPVVKTVNQTGWRDNGVFVYPNTPDSKYLLDDKIRTTADKIFSSKGDKKIVIDLLRKAKQNDIANINIGAVLAAPLVKIFGIDNITIHTYALTGSGKSSIMKLATSLFLNPNENHAIASADASRAGLSSYFAYHRDLPAAIDDIENVDERHREVIQKLPYQFANNKAGLRGKPDGGNADMIEYSGTLLTNGEHPLTEGSTKGGAKRRVIELKGDDKLFDTKFAIEINRTVKDNYGLFGRDWIAFIHNNLQLFKDEHEFFIKNLFVEYPNKIPMHLYSLSAIRAALHIFNVYFLNMNPMESISELNMIDNIIQQLPDSVEIRDYERAKEYILDWIGENKKSFMQYKAGFIKEAESYQEYGIIRSDGTIAIRPTRLRKELCAAGFSPEMVLQQLVEVGFIKQGNRKPIYTSLIKTQGDVQRMIIIKIPQEIE